ncbi:MAG: cytochrome c oxidase accessory protein CcoG, partial [Melioribacteraceae bacterium]|nr:cytochrome c oxidase accessory protein CcoG [Melioribacteraceae bacterium]
KSIGYTVVLILLMGLLTFLMSKRKDFELSILRTPGMISQQFDEKRIGNLYDFVLTNKTFDEISVQLKLKNIKGEIKIIGSDMIAKPQDIIEAKFFVIIDESNIKQLNTKIEIAVTSGGKLIDVMKTSFLGKIKKWKQGK